MNDYFSPFQPLLRGGVLMLLCLLLLVACKSGEELDQGTDQQPNFLVINTFPVPVLATPDDQLAYARATFEKIEEKAAALQAIKSMHPNARQHAAIADLELAYLELGVDYRLADAKQCAQATKKYQAVLRDYSDIANIAAKSLWYLGWIACDLRHDKTVGLQYFQEIIDKYPEEIVNFIPAPPWLTIHQTADGQELQASFPKSVLTWADIAHLEIIRHSPDATQAWPSFSAIDRQHQGDGFTGLALKTLIITHGFSDKTVARTRSYLAENGADSALANDLLLFLTDHLRGTPLETGGGNR